MDPELYGKPLKSFTVAVLREELSKRCQSTLGKKAELIERLSQSILTGNDVEMDEIEEDPGEEADEQFTPQKEHDVNEDPFPRKSSRAERYSAKKEKPVDESSFISEDGEDAPVKLTVRRDSAIRRSVLKSLGLNSSAGNAFLTPDKDTKWDSSVRMRTRSRSRERQRTVSVSPSRSKLRPSVIGLPTPPRNGTPRRPPTVHASAQRAISISGVSEAPRSQKRRSISETRQLPSNLPKSTISTLPRGRFADRFAQQHKKLIEKQDTLEQARDRVAKRHEELTKSTSAAIVRLSTPKHPSGASRLPVKNPEDNTGFNFTGKTNMRNFKFGQVSAEDYQTIPKTAPSCTTKRVIEKKLDAKEMTKKKQISRGLTQPLDTTRIAFLSTPKGRTPTRTPPRSGYIPHRGGLKKFVDTTKLSDEQLELAREAGIVGPATSNRKRDNPLIEKNKKRTEELNTIRRKLDH